MTDPQSLEFGDPITAPFWRGATERRLLIQRCADCGHHQFYPRPFCLACQSDRVEWVNASGRGTIYSLTTVRIQISPDFTPPYRVAIVRLEEGPQLLATIVGPPCAIGDPVRAGWKDRADAPPLIMFQPVTDAG